MKTSKILDFLSQLQENNNRDWFQEHKKDYKEAKEAMLALIQQLIDQISRFDSSIGLLEPKQCLFRIYRDVRFSKNKEPYKNNMGGFLVMGGRNSGNAGYYLHLEPGNSFVGGGIHRPEPKQLKAIRDEISYAGGELKSVIEAKEFKNNFFTISGDSLVRPPKGYHPDSEHIELLKMKSFTVFKAIDDSFLSEEDFVDRLIPLFKAMQPFNRFFNRAFED